MPSRKAGSSADRRGPMPARLIGHRPGRTLGARPPRTRTRGSTAGRRGIASPDRVGNLRAVTERWGPIGVNVIAHNGWAKCGTQLSTTVAPVPSGPSPSRHMTWVPARPVRRIARRAPVSSFTSIKTKTAATGRERPSTSGQLHNIVCSWIASAAQGRSEIGNRLMGLCPESEPDPVALCANKRR